MKTQMKRSREERSKEWREIIKWKEKKERIRDKIQERIKQRLRKRMKRGMKTKLERVKKLFEKQEE